MPLETPVTTPLVPIVAMVALLVHVPPPGDDVNGAVDKPTHTEDAPPAIAEGSSFTVIAFVAMQPAADV